VYVDVKSIRKNIAVIAPLHVTFIVSNINLHINQSTIYFLLLDRHHPQNSPVAVLV
jgi:hypothetical protein